MGVQPLHSQTQFGLPGKNREDTLNKRTLEIYSELCDLCGDWSVFGDRERDRTFKGFKQTQKDSSQHAQLVDRDLGNLTRSLSSRGEWTLDKQCIVPRRQP